MEYIQRNPEKSFVYATPFLAEIRRVIERCGRFKQPRNYTGKKGEEHACQKIEDFNNLLLDGEDIAVTHCTFLKATEDTISRIRDGGYVLILDEALDIIVEYNKIEHPIRPKTIPIMVDKGLITATLRSSVVPSISTCSAEIDNSENDVVKSWGIALTGYSRVRIKSSASGAYGSSIISFSISIRTVLAHLLLQLIKLQ